MQNYCYFSQRVRIFYAKLYIFLTNCHQKLQNTHPGLNMQSIIDSISYNSLILIYDVLIVSFSILLLLKKLRLDRRLTSASVFDRERGQSPTSEIGDSFIFGLPETEDSRFNASFIFFIKFFLFQQKISIFKYFYNHFFFSSHCFLFIMLFLLIFLSFFSYRHYWIINSLKNI